MQGPAEWQEERSGPLRLDPNYGPSPVTLVFLSYRYGGSAEGKGKPLAHFLEHRKLSNLSI